MMLKTGMFPGAPSSAFYAMGVGTQIIYIDPKNELVVARFVARWIVSLRLILDKGNTSLYPYTLPHWTKFQRRS